MRPAWAAKRNRASLAFCVMVLQPRQALAFDCHIHLAGEEVRELTTRIVDRRHQQPVPERLTAPAVIADIDLQRLGRLHGGANPRNRRGVCLRPLQKPAVAPHDLIARIAGQPAERFIGEHHGIIAQARVRNDHRHTGRPHCLRERIVAVCEAGELRLDTGTIMLGNFARRAEAPVSPCHIISHRNLLAHDKDHAPSDF
jgi:hypothetical protein